MGYPLAMPAAFLLGCLLAAAHGAAPRDSRPLEEVARRRGALTGLAERLEAAATAVTEGRPAPEPPEALVMQAARAFEEARDFQNHYSRLVESLQVEQAAAMAYHGVAGAPMIDSRRLEAITDAERAGNAYAKALVRVLAGGANLKQALKAVDARRARERRRRAAAAALCGAALAALAILRWALLRRASAPARRPPRSPEGRR